MKRTFYAITELFRIRPVRADSLDEALDLGRGLRGVRRFRHVCSTRQAAENWADRTAESELRAALETLNRKHTEEE